MECSGAANLWPRPTGPVSFSGDFVNFLPRDVSFAVDNRTPPETKVVCTYRTLKAQALSILCETRTTFQDTDLIRDII